MSFLIDTDTLIYSIKGNATVQNRFLLNENAPKALSVITYGELLFGAKKSKHIEKNLAIVYRIKELFPVIEVGKAVIETFSNIKADLQKTGSPVDDMDLLIAATAMTMNYVLVTNNEKHFSKIRELQIENWSK